ncbi:MAG: SUMF1/EgtB/PvdO family nonheme iron enzyme [Bilophila sp.]
MFLFILLSLLVLGGSAVAAGLKARSEADPKDLFNPVPAADDIALPMPCNLSLIFKAIEVPAKGFLWDMSFNMGNDTTNRPGMEYYDRRFATSIAAPFAANDLPKAWQSALPADPKVPFFYYLMGKYEISEAQWQAVMENTCPAPSEQASRPKANISWYDAQAFTQRYNQWLLDNAPDQLPHFAGDDKNIGSTRLPTEAEWEYAARGGSRVPQEVLRQEELYPLAEGETLADYAVFRPDGAAAVQEHPLRIGSRRANPLGLYDMAGNVAEMAQDAFRFSLGGRLHGSSGGFVRKGGGFLSSNAEIMPGRREEVAFFNSRGAVSTSDMGLRLVLSGINSPGGTRTETLMEEWKRIGESTTLAEPGANPLQEIDRLLGMNPDATSKENLTRLRAMLKDHNVALERQRTTAAEGLIRTILYLSETVRNYGVRRDIAYRHVKEISELLPVAKRKKAPELPAMENALKEFSSAQQEMLLAMDSAVNFYKSKLEETAQYPAEVIDYNFNLVANELKQDNLLAKNMRQNLSMFAVHLKRLRAGQTADLSKNRLLKDILPDTLKKGLKL